MASRVVAIDGPAGSGKSTTAKAVAARLGLPYVETGALYRAVTLAALDAGIPLVGDRLVALARSLPIRLHVSGTEPRVEVAGADVSQAIRAERVTDRVSAVAAVAEVRRWVNAEVRSAVSRHPRGAVLEGRDIGTVVFPDAVVKIFLTASPEERARRRLLQERRGSGAEAVRVETEELARRDRLDSTRAVAPLRQHPEAIVVDTTRLSFDEQVERIVAAARNYFS